MCRNNRTDHLLLQAEVLEERQMLSTVEISAAGFDGTESMQLLIDDVAVAEYEVSLGAATAEFQSFTYESDSILTADQIKIAFTNDIFLPEEGLDRNLRVDFISIDGEVYQTEDPSVFSTGTWRPGIGVVPDFVESEVLHTDGFFQFAEPTETTEVKIFAAGRAGDERISLEIAGTEVAQFDLAALGGQQGDLEARNFIELSYTANQTVSPEEVRVSLLNDFFDPNSGSLGRDVRIDKIEIDGIAYDTEDPNVFSTGYAGPGFWEEEILEFNGYFQYAEQAVPDRTLMKFRASGTSGEEIVQLEIDGSIVETYRLSDYGVQPGDIYTGTFAQIIYQHTEEIDPSKVRFIFINDQVDPVTGIDYDLGIDNFKVGGITYQSESPATFSTGSFVQGVGIEPGFWQSESLNGNGYFQYLVDTTSNNAPIANLDRATTAINQAVRGNVIDNDFDADPTQLVKILGNTDPANGTVVMAANGNFIYSPDPGFSGTDFFSYTISDANGGVATSFAVIDVGAESNLAPFAIDDSVQTLQDRAVDGNLLSNDFDLNRQDELAFEVLDSASSGQLTTFSNGDFVYEPTPGFYGVDSFTYLLRDLSGATDVGTVTIEVEQVVEPTIIQVVARGTTGEEVLAVEIDGIEVGSARVSVVDDVYEFRIEETLSPEENVFRVRFTNDLFSENVNRDLIVDRIVVNGVAYETEADTTYTTGSWQGFGLPLFGYQNTEVLTNDGYFEFLATSDITVHASGDEGTEVIELQIDDQTVATFELGLEYQDFVYAGKIGITPDQIKISFSGDVFDPDNGIDKNANIAFLETELVRIQTSDRNIFSTGTWRAEDGIAPGFGRGITLHTDGYFQFAEPAFVLDDSFDVPEDSVEVPLAVFANDPDVPDSIEINTPPENGEIRITDGVVYYTPDREFTGRDVFTYRTVGSTGPGIDVEINVLPSHQQPQSLLNPQVASELTPSGKFLTVAKVAQVPNGDNGGPARMNSMTTLGDRIFIVSDGSVQGEGKIYELVSDQAGRQSVDLFFDVGAAVTANSGWNIDNSSPLNGLRSLAFHPEFASNGKLYVTYTGERPDESYETTYLSDPENPVDVESVLAEFTFDFELDRVDANSYREVFRVGMNNSEHSIRQAVFNPYAQPGDEDYGLLYIGHGDGSEQSAISGDGLNNDGLGKILRVNPLQNGTSSYTIPNTNPFVGNPDMIDEAFAIGFRNPHNLTFALDESGQAKLVVTEIGRDNIEEVNVVEAGKSYGWGDREGVFVHRPFSGTINGLR